MADTTQCPGCAGRTTPSFRRHILVLAAMRQAIAVRAKKDYETDALRFEAIDPISIDIDRLTACPFSKPTARAA